jgi:hypothetical protein
MKIEHLLLIILGLVFLYFIYNCNGTFSNKVENFPGTENFDNTAPLASDPNKLTDLEAVQNLGSIAKMLMAGGLTVPGNMTVSGNFNYLPTGIIVSWWGKSVPSGWTLCDGTNGTPDLRNRFIYGASAATDSTSIGGAATTSFTLATNNVPPHTHTYINNYASDCRNVTASGESGCWMSGPPASNTPETSKGNVGSNNNGASGTDPVTINIIPPFYQLAYIMKI